MQIARFREMGSSNLSTHLEALLAVGALQAVSSHSRVWAACSSLNLGQSLFHQKHMEGGER